MCAGKRGILRVAVTHSGTADEAVQAFCDALQHSAKERGFQLHVAVCTDVAAMPQDAHPVVLTTLHPVREYDENIMGLLQSVSQSSGAHSRALQCRQWGVM